MQNLWGIMDSLAQQREGLSERDSNRFLMRVELHADYLAGVWAHHAQKMKAMLEQGDVEEAMGAAAAVGDDRIQKQTQGYVVPDSFTHGTARQRTTAFQLGFRSGRVIRRLEEFVRVIDDAAL